MSQAARLPFFSLAPDSLKAMINLSRSVGRSSIGERIFELVNLRVSQVNGCGVCVDMHWRDLEQLEVEWLELHEQLEGLAA
jgi:AhpD family alkylhydroperoxidase